MVAGGGAGSPTNDGSTASRESISGVHVGLTPSALLAGVLGGLVGTAAFGLLMWALDLEFVRSFVPAMLGLEQRGLIGWAIHLLTGAMLGAVFAALVSRPIVVEAMVPDSDEPHLGPPGLGIRLVAAGIVFGLAVWAILPMVVLPVWLGYVGAGGVEEIPGTALQSLAGHAVFGTLLGVVYTGILRTREGGREPDDRT